MAEKVPYAEPICPKCGDPIKFHAIDANGARHCAQRTDDDGKVMLICNPTTGCGKAFEVVADGQWVNCPHCLTPFGRAPGSGNCPIASPPALGEVEIAEIEQRYQQASGGDWYKRRAGICGPAGQVYAVHPPQFTMHGSMTEADADFIVAAHNTDIPRLISTIRSLRADLAEREKERDEAKQQLASARAASERNFELSKEGETPDAHILEVRRWWDAFGSHDTPTAIRNLAEETLSLRQQLDDAKRRGKSLCKPLECLMNLAESNQRVIEGDAPGTRGYWVSFEHWIAKGRAALAAPTPTDDGAGEKGESNV